MKQYMEAAGFTCLSWIFVLLIFFASAPPIMMYPAWAAAVVGLLYLAIRAVRGGNGIGVSFFSVTILYLGANAFSFYLLVQMLTA